MEFKVLEENVSANILVFDRYRATETNYSYPAMVVVIDKKVYIDFYALITTCHESTEVKTMTNFLDKLYKKELYLFDNLLLVPLDFTLRLMGFFLSKDELVVPSKFLTNIVTTLEDVNKEDVVYGEKGNVSKEYFVEIMHLICYEGSKTKTEYKTLTNPAYGATIYLKRVTPKLSCFEKLFQFIVKTLKKRTKNGWL